MLSKECKEVVSLEGTEEQCIILRVCEAKAFSRDKMDNAFENEAV